ncbi:photosynthetic complex assembly protein PuhC [Sphingomonas jaspsi]|uniref:photosynthetic complex assembly protein PuhC n=1 Tax=Sphingomonas jaspsi TaxID=392409 RepID=UPI0004B4C7E8|nr:photosynthetic complex assembly protein PuhC [Sphingomonas jaspsi]
MSLAHDHANTVPRPALIMAGSLVVFSLMLAASVQLGLAPRSAVPGVERADAHVAEVESRLLSFRDQPDGSVRIVDASSGADVLTVVGEKDGGGFIRGVLRGLARDRRMRGIGAEPPFELALWQDGALSLTDRATGRTIELGSFGPDNRAAFARLLPKGATA